jgi:hypothetical protein
VAARTCWEYVPNKALLGLEGKLKLSEATVLDDPVTSLGLKLIVKNESSCSTISRHILKYSDVWNNRNNKGNCKG